MGPQRLGYGLADSPVGQAAWIYEKLWAWTDNQGNPEDALTLDEMLDNIMLYWLPWTATSSARLYWESFAMGVASVRLEIPVGVSVYPAAHAQTIRGPVGFGQNRDRKSRDAGSEPRCTAARDRIANTVLDG